MPASRKVSFFDGLAVSVTPRNGGKGVYYTDEEPRFTLEITNDSEYDFADESVITWHLAIGSGKPDSFHSDTVEFELDRGESEEFVIGGETLVLEGHGIIGVSVGGAAGKSGTDKRVLQEGRGHEYSPSLTFAVVDREYYNAVHAQPKKLLLISFIATVVIAISAFVDILGFIV